MRMRYFWDYCVSTHSRLKAAGIRSSSSSLVESCFNTQPPEGGWEFVQFDKFDVRGFNTQPPEGGWFRRLYL